MQESPSIAVLIATYNRSKLLERALLSVLNQSIAPKEIIVIDDASTDDTREVMSRYQQVIYFRLPENSGVGKARNFGLAKSNSEWVTILDDDDELIEAALHIISSEILSFPSIDDKPVLQFSHENGVINKHINEVTLENYLKKHITGDFIPVIQVKRFSKLGFSYPVSRVGSEHLLWWKVASEYPIPTWNIKIGKVGTDAPIRLTSIKNQIQRAREYAEMQEKTLAQFGDDIRKYAPNLEKEKVLGASFYRLLSGDRKAAASHAFSWTKKNLSIESSLLLILCLMPISVVKWCFILYRKSKGSSV
jgi:GalNAc5-diNAcBac-PP-undecaprenol beta-1,3-glucosyltransferase